MAGTNTRSTSLEWKNGSRARQLGLNTHIILDGCRGIELEPGDINRALDEMKRVGAVLLESSDL
jgi:nicotinamidase/pyrazinamidase